MHLRLKRITVRLAILATAVIVGLFILAKINEIAFAQPLVLAPQPADDDTPGMRNAVNITALPDLPPSASLPAPAAPGLANQPANGPSLSGGPGGSTTVSALSLSCNPNSNVALELKELARALKYDPDLIYEFVYNNIKVEPVYGGQKGPLGALLERSGSPFDVTELMYVLLEQSCYSPHFVRGTIRLNNFVGDQYPNYMSWLQTDDSQFSAKQILSEGGFGPSNSSVVGGKLVRTDIKWAWIKVNIGGMDYVFDPATKCHAGSGMTPQLDDQCYTVFNGIDLAAALNSGAGGYVRLAGSSSNYTLDAESTATIDDGVTGLNRATMRSDLTNYASLLTSYLRTNYPNYPDKSLEEVIGGTAIIPLPVGYPHLRQTSLPYQQTVTCDDLIGPCMFSGTTNLRTTLKIKLQGWASNIEFNVSDIYGKRIVEKFDDCHQDDVFVPPPGRVCTPVLLIDGAPQGSPGSAIASGGTRTVTLTITHAYGGANGSSALNVTALANQIYLIANGWGRENRGVIEYHRKRLRDYTAQGISDTDERVLGESLSILASTWLAENSRFQQIVDQVGGNTGANPLGTTTIWHHAVGIAGVKALIGNPAQAGPYVDLPLNTFGIIQRYNRPDPATLPTSASPTAAEMASYYVAGGMLSVLESGSIEQTQNPSNAIAASTTKLLDQWSQSGKIFDIDNTYNNAGCSYYLTYIRPTLQVTYQTGDLTRIDGLVRYTGGVCQTTGTFNRVIAPSNGLIGVNGNLWQGAAYLSIGPAPTNTLGWIITGGLSGGYPASNVPTSAMNINSKQTQRPTAEGLGNADQNGGDPLNLVSGFFLYRHSDFSVGNGGFPYELSFERFYDSGRRLQFDTMGAGWTHNFVITALQDSDGFEGMGEFSAISAAPAITAAYVATDLVNTENNSNVTNPVTRIVEAAITETWLMEKLTNNIVVVTQPGYTEHFVKLADGTFNAPIGSAAALTGSPGAYTYTTKDKVVLSFNSAGKIASWHHPSGPTVTFSYGGPGGNLSLVNNGMNRMLSFSYGTGNRVSQVSDGARSVGYDYDGSGNLTGFHDPLNKVTTFAYDIPGRMTQIFYPSRPSNAFLTNTYDTVGHVQTQTDANGNLSTPYFAGEARAEIDDAAGNAHVTYFTSRRKTRAEVDPLQNITQYDYDSLDRLIKTTFPEGNSISYGNFDGAHNVRTITKTPKAGSGLTAVQQTFTYDSTYNKVHTATDENGKTTTYNYDSATGNLLSVVQPLVNGQNPTTSYTYNGRGQVLTVNDQEGKQTFNIYSSTDETLSESYDDYGSQGLRTQFGYSVAGDVESIVDPLGRNTAFGHDNARRVMVATKNSTIYIVNYTYDDDGNLLTTTVDPGSSPHLNLVTTNTYTPSFKLKTSKDPSNNATTYNYDVLDRVSSVVDAAGRTTSYQYDADSRVYRVFNTAIQAGPLEQHTFYLNGREYQFTDARGKVTTYTYDGFDRPKRSTFADSSYEENSSYDYVGNVLIARTRSGNTITNTYDPLNRLATKAPQGSPTITYGYDRVSRMTSATDGSSTFTFHYNSTGKLDAEIYNLSDTVYFDYDRAGNRSKFTYPDSYYVSYNYDELNRVTDILENGTTLLAHYTYDGASRRATLTYGNGKSATYGYAPNSDLISIAQTMGSGVTFTYGYNQVHQRTSVSVTDSNYLLIPTTTPAISYTPNDVNKYTSVGGNTVTYDDNGNLKNDGVNAFTYDVENRLLTFSGNGNSASYTYDPLGRRRSKTVNGVTTIYYSAGNQEIAEYNGAYTGMLRRYIYGPGIDEPIVTINCSSTCTKSYNHQDALGSVIALSDTSGNVVSTDIYTYGPYGQSSTTAGNAFRFAGRRLDAETGLYYYRARMYSPALGRFLQNDPIGYAGGNNLYAYVGNDPVNLIDPTGTVCQTTSGTLACTSPGGIQFSVPAPNGFPSHLGPVYRDYHAYNVRVPAGKVSPDALMAGVMKSPTPGSPAAATSGGTLNDATPTWAGTLANSVAASATEGRMSSLGNISPVLSYGTTDQNGLPIVVNVTLKGHPLNPGYVVRYVTTDTNGQSILNNEGEGIGILQSNSNPLAGAINNVWSGQSQAIIDDAGRS